MRVLFETKGRILAILLAAVVFTPMAAKAQTRLPWADANPLERLFGAPKNHGHGTRRNRTAEKAAVTPPPVAAVPVPDARPAGPMDDAPVVSGAAPVPEQSPADAEGGAVAEEAVPANEAKSPAKEPDEGAVSKAADAAEPSAESKTPAVSADPAATAETPVEEIPVPEQRPPAPVPPATAVPVPPVPETAAPVPVEAPKPALDDAPNATDKLKARIPEISPADSVLAAAAIADAEFCEAELKKRGVVFTVGESIAEGECGVLRPVNVETLSSGVAVSPDTRMLCRTALALDDWMTGTVVPAAKRAFPEDRLTEFRHASTYVCRPRASEKGISEHARGSAIDIAAFVFAEGKEIGIETQKAGTPEARFQDAMRAGACGPFKTVLGPGTDADHATHFHLDIAARRNGSTYCK